MKKEVLIAIIIGFGLGLIIAVGIWRARNSLQKVDLSTTNNQTNQTISPTPTPVSSLTILTPENNFLSNQEKITVTGKTSPEATVAIVYQEGEKIVTADNSGNFSSEITLIGGANEIRISAFDIDGNESSLIINGVYSTTQI